jgi:hypothetical protein
LETRAERRLEERVRRKVEAPSQAVETGREYDGKLKLYYKLLSVEESKMES